MDVKTAFLNDDLDEAVYTDQQAGFITEENENKIHKLEKSIHGLKQASRQWNLKLHESVVNLLKIQKNLAST